MNVPNSMVDQMGRGAGYPDYDVAGRSGVNWFDIAGQQPYGYGGYGYDAMGQCGPIGAGAFGGCGPCPIPANPFVFAGWPVNGCPPFATFPPGANLAAAAALNPVGCPVAPDGTMALAPPVATPAMVAGAPPGYAQMGNGLVPGAFPGAGFGDPWGCFGPPVTPLAVQQMQQPLAFLRPRCPRELRLEAGGLGCVCVPAGDSVTLECDAPALMKLVSLTIPGSVADSLVVEDISAGRECLLICGPAPAAMFKEDSKVANQRIAEVTLDEGEKFSITLRNITATDQNVCVGFVAWVLVK